MEKVNIFSDPAKIDAVVKSKLAQFNRKGGKIYPGNVSWSESELELIDGVIWGYITEQGLSREKTAQQIADRWNIALSTARKYISDSIKRMAKNIPEEDVEERRRKFLERCESILQDAIENRQKDSALKALDLIAKASGLYKETKEVDINGNMTFDFQ